MTRPELVVKGKVLIGGSIQTICIGIDEGKIVVLGKDLDGDRFIDHSRYLIMPGGVDIHTHMREPGMEHKEDFDTGTMAAAFGGTTTILDMPNTIPPVATPGAINEKLDIISGKANIDYGIYAALMPGADIAELKKKAIGFKLFMAETTSAQPLADDEMRELLAHPELEGEVVAVHAENPSLFQGGGREIENLVDHDDSRPVKAEISAVEKVLGMPTLATLHLAHLTCLESFDRALEYSTEATPHHLFLSTSYHLGTLGKVNPPLRNMKVQASLFSAFVRGRVGIVASDHAPHTMDEKEQDFGKAPGGLPGVETRIPLLLGLVHSEQVSLGLVQATCCHNPATLFGMKKGHIEVGYDADLAIYDIKEVTRIQGEELHSKCGWTPFENYNAIFPKFVMLGGEIILSENELIKGRGKPI